MTAYATTTEFANILGIVKRIPDWDVGDSPTKEEVGTGDGSTLIFYLDQKNILADSYTLYYGATEATAVAFTETTHYSLDKETGKITLTTSGRTVLSTDNIYAEYKYLNIGMTDAYLQTVLERAKKEVDSTLNTIFTDGTAKNPSYPVVVLESQESQGLTQQRYWSKKRPLIDVSSSLADALTASGTTAGLASGDGSKFPSSGSVVVEEEIIDYTGVSTDTLTGLTRGSDGSTAAAHAAEKEVHSTIVQISGTREGTIPTWFVQEWKKKVFVGDLGETFLYWRGLQDGENIAENILLPEIGIANRFKIRYLYGFDTIPADIVRLNLLLAKRQLIQDNIGKSMIAGRDEFNPEMFNADQTEIARIVDAYRQNAMGNT